MKLIASITLKRLRTCLFIQLALCDSVVTSRSTETFMNILNDKRYDVQPRDVMTHSSKLGCAATCRDTSWCVSVNLFTVDGTCQLLSEEASNETSLESADGWRYLREIFSILLKLLSIIPALKRTSFMATWCDVIYL